MSAARAERASSCGRVARSSSASDKSCAEVGSGRAIHGRRGGAGGGTVGSVSNRTVVMSTAEMPSTSAWWLFAISAKRPSAGSSSPPQSPSRSTSHISHSGFVRSSGWANSRPARFCSCSSLPGAGRPAWRRW